jgi:amidophosphoribosyltransferase
MAIKEFCGLFGVWGDPDSVRLTYYGLFSLQHRGQESAGIASVKNGTLEHHRGMGLVADVFKEDTIQRLASRAAIGHTRYSTTGVSDLINAQPLVVRSSHTTIALAHNGNLVNTREVRALVADGGQVLPNVFFHTTTDSELILVLLSKYLREDLAAALKRALSHVRGAYSLLLLTPQGMYAARDPNGFRPLCLGRKGDAWAVASETCAFDLTGFKPVRDVEPGEIVSIDDAGPRSSRIVPKKEAIPSHCMFEYIYFSRPDSAINGQAVHEVRRRLGRRLAVEHPVQADVVTPIPDSGNLAALGFAEQAGIPFGFCFVRNHYIGRTFIQPISHQRETNVRLKLAAVRSAVDGRRVVVVDDSVVRGTTVRSRIRLLRDAGAREVHLRVSCPPIRHPCFYGIDFPTREELIATGRTVDEIREFVGADTLGYLSLEGMLSCAAGEADRYCTACWSGSYPVSIADEPSKFKLHTPT